MKKSKRSKKSNSLKIKKIRNVAVEKEGGNEKKNG